MTKRSLLAAALALAGSPALAADPASGPQLWDRLPATPPADSGKARLGTPPPVPLAGPDSANCAPALPCGARLLGTVRHNGAVELQVPAWRW